MGTKSSSKKNGKEKWILGKKLFKNQHIPREEGKVPRAGGLIK